MRHKFLLFTVILGVSLFLNPGNLFAQVTVTSSDSLNCTTTCTTLNALLTGDNPTDAGITEDDIYTALIPIGFTFNFYGTNYTQCVIGANGNVSFTSSLAGAYDPWPISSAILGNTSVLNSICGPWCDIDIFYTGTPIGTETYSTDGVAPNRKFSVTWCNCSMFSCGAQRIITQIIMYETTNIIEVHISKKQVCAGWNGGYAIVGVQNAAGTAATAAPGRNYPSVWTIPPTEAWRFTPAAGGASYTVSSIPYAPIPYESSLLYWYNATTGAYLGTGTTQVVCPTTPTLYKCGAIGCADTSFGYYMVTPTGSITFTTTTVNPTTCGGCNGSITFSGLTPGYSDTVRYSYNGTVEPAYVATVSATGTITLPNLCAGVYSPITVTQGTCTSLPVIDTLFNPPISMTGTSTNNTFCGLCDGTITLNGLYGSTGYTITYDFNGVAVTTTGETNPSGSLTISGLCAGTYSNVVAAISSSAAACVTPAIGPFIISPPPTPLLNVISSTNPSQCGFCDGTITITAVIPLSTDTVFYSVNGGATVSTTTIAQSDSAIVLTGLCGGVYSGFSVKIGSCLYTVDGSATLVSPYITPSFDTAIHFGCHGDTVSFTNLSSTTPPGGTLYYIWTFGDGTTDTSLNTTHVYTAQGTYTVTLVADNHHCDTAYSVVLPLLHPLVASFTMDTNLICQDKLITFTNTSIISDGYYGTFLWSFGNGVTDTNKNATYTFLNTGTYTVQLIATDWVPCHDTTSAVVQVDTISGIALLLTDTVICEGTYITYSSLYSGVGNTGNLWNFGDGTSLANANPVIHAFDAPGVYTITVTADYRACPDTSISRTVTVFSQPSIYIGPDTSICLGGEPLTLSDNINAGNPLASWLWNTGQTTSSITIVAPGIYYATVNINNCYASDTISVASDCYIDIPNAFTPNGDGVNDYFFPRQMLTKGLVTFSMNIYDRWGELIFQTTTLDGRGWDGRFNGIDQPNGVYVYIIDATFIDGQKEHHQGNLTLLR